MLIIIEHSGSETHNKEVQEIAYLLEDTYGATVQPVVADEGSSIILRDENLNIITEFPNKPDDDIIHFYIGTYSFDED